MGYIVDLSYYNTVTDWAAAANDLDAAILRLGYRGSIKGRAEYRKITEDVKFGAHLEGCRKHGIPYGVYFFPTGITEEEAVEEADWICKRVKDLNVCMPVFLDSEYVMADQSGRADRLSKADRTHFLRVITDHLLAEGIPCGIYGCPNWFRDNVDLSRIAPEVIEHTWVAKKKGQAYKAPVYLWQYGKKKVSWTTAPVDVSRCSGRRGHNIKSLSGIAAAIMARLFRRGSF